MILNKKTLLDLAGIVLLAGIVWLGYQFSPLLLPAADQTIFPPKECDLHQQACPVTLSDGGRLTLSMQPRPIPLMKPFTVEVQLDGWSAEQVDVDFSGVEMNMGLNRFALLDQGQGRWIAEASIPVCVTGRMEWQAAVTLSRGQQRISIPFRFISGEHAQ